MRNTDSSGNTSLTISLSSIAESRSCPNGFSMTTRRHWWPFSPELFCADSPERASCLQTTGKSDGGIDR